MLRLRQEAVDLVSSRRQPVQELGSDSRNTEVVTRDRAKESDAKSSAAHAADSVTIKGGRGR
jgi:hypothetical protein